MRILIIKLGAMGDVLRTTPLLAAYRKRYPRAHITWLVAPESVPLLEHNPLIDDLIAWEADVPARLGQARYDLAVNLDKEKEALDAAEAVRADKKQGFGWDERKSGVAALNPESDYAVRLGLDDELKFRQNRKTYQEICFEQTGLVYGHEEYVFPLEKDLITRAGKHLKALGLSPEDVPHAVGLNTGAGDRFAGKRLPEDHIAVLARRIHTELGRRVLLLGGPAEHERNRRLEKTCAPHALNAGTDHAIREFAGLVSRLALVITGDTIAMHVAIAVRVPVLVFFGSTCAPEIELYDRGAKVVSALDCAPCYKRVCPIQEKCMTDMSVDRLFNEARNLLEANKSA